ncbi:MAG: YceG family protein [Microgenomates group bacterium GW2011_GWC1_44_9]|nr:MAG: YceG family protein [Microgenomates group bacterium GW2011_GWC1_44_9]
MLKRFFIAITLLAMLGLAWYFQAIQPVTRERLPTVDFEIKPGTGIDQIANDLSVSRLIRSRVAFKITVIRLGIASKIQAGYFKLTPSMDATDLAEALTRAYARQVRVTIPEGLRSEEINLLLEKAFSQTKDNQYNPSEFTSLSRGKEGHLFPDTYDFIPEASASDIIRRMTDQFEKVTVDISKNNLKEIIILASLLEREAASSQEMPKVAGVMIKRIEADWPLQIDATVQYALGSVRCKQLDCDWWKDNLSKEDIRFNSPYNTYLNTGLPPAPISNPGRDALKAAASPEKSSAWFYLHDSNGNIHYADTIEQHNKNICLYLKKDCK